MPVKKTIRRKKPTPLSTFAWMRKPVAWMRTPVAWMRKQAAWIRKPATWSHAFRGITRVMPSMDRSMAAPLLATGAMIVALLIVGYRMTPANAVADDPSFSAPSHEETTVATKPIASAVVHESTVASAAEAPVVTPQLVTIAGCLAQDGDSFRLKDTSGADAPRTRSWKTGFLRKGNASVDVVDASRRLKLTNHIGERVSMTGTIVDGEMQVRSLRRVSTSCGDNKPKVNA